MERKGNGTQDTERRTQEERRGCYESDKIWFNAKDAKFRKVKD